MLCSGNADLVAAITLQYFSNV